MLNVRNGITRLLLLLVHLIHWRSKYLHRQTIDAGSYQFLTKYHPPSPNHRMWSLCVGMDGERTLWVWLRVAADGVADHARRTLWYSYIHRIDIDHPASTFRPPLRYRRRANDPVKASLVEANSYWNKKKSSPVFLSVLGSANAHIMWKRITFAMKFVRVNLENKECQETIQFRSLGVIFQPYIKV